MKDKKQKSTKVKSWVWPLKVLLTAVILSFSFSLISEFVLSKTHVAVAVVVIVIFVVLSMFFDMLGLAAASSSLENFNAMASRKVKGSKQAISLAKNADKVSSICADVIGDVCGILSGAAGASILAKIALSSNLQAVLVASTVSAVIAALTIFGKASLKKIAITHADAITLKFAQFINIFTRKG